MQRRHLLAGLGALALPAAQRAARAQGWAPDKPLRLIVGFAAGGSTDLTARLVAQALGERLGQPVVVENRPGAGGNIAAEATARAAPDGYTIHLVTSGVMAANKALYRSLPFDPLKDFAPVGQVAFIPNLIVVNPELPVRNPAELIAYAKARPGQVNYGSAGAGTSLHMAAALFAARAGVEMVHIPYRGGAPAATDLIAGKIQMIASPMIEVLGAVKAGQLRAIAVTTAKRSPALPEVPTVAETLPGFEIALWNGLGAPAGTPPAAIQRISAELLTALGDPTTRQKLTEQGSEPAPNTPEQFADFIRTELPRWAEIVKISGASVD
ncbi:tripartite tricarboxylate transporter substrate binding protein [Siccirubricoccus sp. KC 17139]|uniref:Tripartite tricarboxylate transporter substrate binding protein n=1 Tax=Siccirubricoccus soli TaxID=2899147 RepID=A0ABT1D9R6_9PROT|nr:tripartite tricarboxylate transporter substrate binding protein [Siccirubricoccus soli]MCO6418677.1 tripartite tricarboxylate transporter substrate binding protein [Siccirubricoccus soli]MCP2684812.1 tripartite tricarboxylate transporter substrate binding protein [Siccirubricoccus soli]